MELFAKAKFMIFVTGGTGLLGNSIVRDLCQRGLPTRVLCRRGTPRLPFKDLPVEIIEGDLGDTEVLESAIRGCTAVIHSAALIHIGWQKLAESRLVNVVGTENIVQACLKHSTKLLHISTVDTLPAAIDRNHPIDERAIGGVTKTQCSYVVSKTEAEQVVRRAIETRGLAAVILNPGFMLGPWDWKPSSGRMFLEVTKAPIVAAPRGGCSLCDARDVAAAVVNALERGVAGQSYILAGENLTYFELWTKMLAVAGKPKHVFRMGPGIRIVGKAIDLANTLLGEGDVNGAAISMGQLNHFYDSSLAKRELGLRTCITNNLLLDSWRWISSLKSRLRS